MAKRAYRTCNDCCLPLIWVDGGKIRGANCVRESKDGKVQMDEHPGLCCDCYDERLGMPENCRSRPRQTRR